MSGGPRDSQRALLVPVALHFGLALLAVVPVGTGLAAQQIVRGDPRFDALVPADAVIEKVADGHVWVEGPAWSRRDSALYFSDIPENSVYRWRAGAGVTLALRPSGYSGTTPFTGREPGSNGLTFDSQGLLVLCQHGDRRVARLESDGRLIPLVERFDGRQLNSPNDLVFGSDGSLFFTDPPFGLPGTFQDPAKELDFSGVYRLSPDGHLTLLTRELTAPNGIALAPDGRTLYVSNADSQRAVYMAFPLRPDGRLGPGRVLFDATAWTAAAPGNPDGLKVDTAGNIFAAGPGGVHVFTPDGSHLGSFLTGVPTANVGWGEDGSTLFTASGSRPRARGSEIGARSSEMGTDCGVSPFCSRP